MRHLWMALFWWLSAWPVEAQLGESLEQCRSRYGEAVERKDPGRMDEMAYFRQGDMKIAAGFKEGRCVLLILGKESGEKLNPVEIERLLEANRGDAIWKKGKPAVLNEVWSRSDGFAVARFSPLEGILTLVTTEYMKQEMAKREALSY